jgi:hypothetical protein
LTKDRERERERVLRARFCSDDVRGGSKDPATNSGGEREREREKERKEEKERGKEEYERMRNKKRGVN